MNSLVLWRELLTVLHRGRLKTQPVGDGRAKPDRSHNEANTYLVESRGYFLPDKPSSVPDSNLNSEDEVKNGFENLTG